MEFPLPVVLIIDDYADAADMYGVYLTLHGYHVLRANSGAAGIEIAHLALPNIILVDLHMPWMTGFQVLNTLREDEAFHTVPIVAFTAYGANSAAVNKAERAGFDAIILKPTAPDKVLDVLDRLLGRTSTE